MLLIGHADYTVPTRQHELQIIQILQIRDDLSVLSGVDNPARIDDMFEAWENLDCPYEVSLGFLRSVSRLK